MHHRIRGSVQTLQKQIAGSGLFCGEKNSDQENILKIERIVISFDGVLITKFQVERALGAPIEQKTMYFPEIEDKSLVELMDEYEKYILETMMDTYGRASEVGRALGMSKVTLSRKLCKYGLNKKECYKNKT